MEYLKQPKKRPEYRGERDHGTFLARVGDHVSDLSLMQSSILESLGLNFIVEEVDFGFLSTTVQKILHLQGKSIDELTKTVYL